MDDGLEALKGNETELARRLFEHLIATFPGTAEAGRAALELEVMGGEGVVAEADARGAVVSPIGVAGGSARIAEFRRELLLDIGDRVFFSENSSEIGGRARAVIDHQARWLKKHPGLIVTVIGRADDGGTAEQASILAGQRAEAVRARLLAGGVEHDRVLIESRGDRDPLAVCRSALCQAQNRHVETMVGAARLAGQGGQTAR
ncbi:MAG: OmpA family protein [Hyphomicrobium sp.]